MKCFAAALGVCCILAQTQAWADEINPVSSQQSDPVFWLERIAAAGQRLNYSGVFTYQSGDNFETSRIAHVVDAQGEHEHLEVLDGSPREVIRTNSEVRCILPEQRTIIVDKASQKRMFPANLPTSFSGLSDHYVLSLGSVSRIAGRDTQLVILKPKDALRYGHMLWAEVNSGLLLKARMIDETGGIVEQFIFSNVTIDNGAETEPMASRHAREGKWQIVSANGDEIRPEDSQWMLMDPLPGYVLKSIMRRTLGQEHSEILHYLFSDGLASISVFIEPLAQKDDSMEEASVFANGSIHIYRRKVEGFLVTVLGEVPFDALKRLGEGVGRTAVAVQE